VAGAVVALPAVCYALACAAAGVVAARRGIGYLLTVPLALATIALGFGVGFALGGRRAVVARPTLSESEERSPDSP
jgi:hypothetical protein